MGLRTDGKRPTTDEARYRTVECGHEAEQDLTFAHSILSDINGFEAILDPTQQIVIVACA